MTVHDHQLYLWITSDEKAFNQKSLVFVKIGMANGISLISVLLTSGGDQAPTCQVLKCHPLCQGFQKRRLADARYPGKRNDLLTHTSNFKPVR